MVENLVHQFFSVFHSYSSIESSFADKCIKWMELTYDKILPPIEEDDGRERTVLNEKEAEQVKRLTAGFNREIEECLSLEIPTEFKKLENDILSHNNINKVVKQIASNLLFLPTEMEKKRYAITLLFPFRRIASNKDRFHEILKLPFFDRYCVQNCLQLLYGAMILFADNLDAVLIQHRINLLALQDECCIHLIKERNKHAAYSRMGQTLADKYLSALPKRQGVQPQQEQPALGERIAPYCEKAIQAGFMEKTDSGYRWIYGDNRGKVRLAYFIKKIYGVLERIPYKGLESLFDVKRLDTSVQQLADRKKSQPWEVEIDNIF